MIICEVAAENAAAARDLLIPYGYRFYDGELAGVRTPLADPPYSSVALSEVTWSAKSTSAP